MLDQAIDRAPDFVLASYHRTYAYFELGDRRKAASDCTSARRESFLEHPSKQSSKPMEQMCGFLILSNLFVFGRAAGEAFTGADGAFSTASVGLFFVGMSYYLVNRHSIVELMP